MARAYSVFANGGYRIEPYVVQRIVDDRGNVLAQAQPPRAGDESLRVIDARNAFVMDSMLHDVVRYGTGARAMSLGRMDLAGKTGTTNDLVDAWFAGYQPSLVAIAWIGFDEPRKLGNHETGAVAALPIWMNYMGKALKGVDEMFQPVPDGVVSVKVDPTTGLPAADGTLSISIAKMSRPQERPMRPQAARAPRRKSSLRRRSRTGRGLRSRPVGCLLGSTPPYASPVVRSTVFPDCWLT